MARLWVRTAIELCGREGRPHFFWVACAPSRLAPLAPFARVRPGPLALRLGQTVEFVRLGP